MEIARSQAADQELLKVQAQRLGRVLGADIDDEAAAGMHEEPGGPTFAEAVQQLASAAGMDSRDLSGLLSHYRQLEAANFAAFSECNEANERIAVLNKEIRALQVCAQGIDCLLL